MFRIFLLHILPEFPFLLSSSGVHPALVFLPFSPSEYLDKAVLLSPQYNVACFLLLLPFFPSLHGQFNHIHETSTVFHLAAETILLKSYKALCLFSSSKDNFCKKVMRLQSQSSSNSRKYTKAGKMLSNVYRQINTKYNARINMPVGWTLINWHAILQVLFLTDGKEKQHLV